MPATAKKYKLRAVGPDGPGVCAFFVSARGCRNGSNCKFLHTTAGANATTNNNNDTMVSSESEEEEEVVEEVRQRTVSTAYSSMGNKKAPELRSLVKAKEEAKPKRKTKDPTANPKQKVPKVEHPSSESSEDEYEEASVDTSPPVVKEEEPKSNKKNKKQKQQDKPAASLANRLNLPVTSFSAAPVKQRPDSSEEEEEAPTRRRSKDKQKEHKYEKKPEAPEYTHHVIKQEEEESGLPMPKSEEGAKWKKAINATRSNLRYKRLFDFSKYKEEDEKTGYTSSTWVKTSSKDVESKRSNPKVIAIDCEMCETEDPVTGAKDPRALIRISVVDGETDELLLDTLVKPSLPVSDYRTRIHGIGEEHLEKVQFTLRHAQAFCLKLCTPETVVIGHAVYNDFAALRWEHFTAVDTACLFRADDSDRATVSLKDLTKTILNVDMPTTHDSVNDARQCLACAKHYCDNDGNVAPIVRSNVRRNSRSSSSNPLQTTDLAEQLLVHRLPPNVSVGQIKGMIAKHTHTVPITVDPIREGQNKTYVRFASAKHAAMAFATLKGRPTPDLSGLLQKKIHLKNGEYIRVRCMVPPEDANDDE